MKKMVIGVVFIMSVTPFAAFAQRDIACSITATPTRAAPGEQVTLRWNSQNARSATLVGFGPVPLSGSRVIQATQTTDYKIMVSGYANNHVGCIARITVSAKQPTCNMSLVPFAVASNNFATLSWSTDYADSVYISGIGNVQPKGNQMVRAVGNTTYYLTARSAGGICEKSAELSVRDQYQSYGYFTPTVQSIAYPLFGYSLPQKTNTQSYPSYNSNTNSNNGYYEEWAEYDVDRADQYDEWSNDPYDPYDDGRHESSQYGDHYNNWSDAQDDWDDQDDQDDLDWGWGSNWE